MWITERNGKYVYTERFTDELTGKTKKLSVTLDKMTAKAKKEAYAILSQKWEKVRSGANLTLSGINERYLRYVQQNFKEQTYIQAKRRGDRLLKMIGDVKVDQLTAGYIEDQLQASGKRTQTINTYISGMKTMLKWAFTKGYTENKVFEKLNLLPLPKSKKADISEKYLEDDEIQKILASIEEPHNLYLTKFLLFTGCRIGEAIALDMDDIDFRNKLIHITKTKSSVTHKIGTPKSAAGFRDVRMQPELILLCRQIRQATLKDRLMFPEADRSAFLLNDEGRRVASTTYQKYFGSLCESVLGRRLTPHALRHTHVSILAAKGISLDMIARRLGHETSDITKKIYYHVTKKQKEKDYAAMDAISIL